jgi:hypothetical protein
MLPILLHIYGQASRGSKIYQETTQSTIASNRKGKRSLSQKHAKE